MNYLIFDTEQTYNYGYIVVDEKGNILLKENLILTNNFENRKLIGENTYKRKKSIYEKDPCARFVNSSEGAKIIAERMKTYDIAQIISHNISEDRRQLELLTQQTGITFPEVPFYDSIYLVKTLFPNNSQTGLEAIVSDIAGIDVKQTHTALADCELLLTLISPIIEYMPYFIKYQEVFDHDADYEVTQLFFTNFNSFPPFPKNIKYIQKVLGMDENRGDKTKLNNFLKKTSSLYHFWELKDCVEYSEKTHKPLKTPGTMVHEGEAFKDAVAISVLYTSLEKIGEAICSACIAHQLSQETDEMILAKLDVYKTTFDSAFAAKEAEFNKKCEEREAALKAKEAAVAKDIANKKAAFARECAAKEAIIKNTVATMIINKIGSIVDGGLFNKDAKLVKQLIKSNDKQKLYDYFNN